MKILIFGKNGQVGFELQRSLAVIGEIIALDRHSSDHCGDLSNLSGIRKTVQDICPDVIVNAAAYTAVDQAENDRTSAMLINAEAVGVLAEEAERINALFVHYSTDYIFNGQGNHRRQEDDQADPLNVYGESKLKGEQLLTQATHNYLLFRTSWVYAASGKNFLKTILRIAQTNEEIKIINDQFGAPTSAELIADSTAHAIVKTLSNPQLCGIYHLTASEHASWWEYATFLIETAKNNGVTFSCNKITPVSSQEFKTAAKRPYNSRLDNQKFQSSFQLVLPVWRDGVYRLIKQLCEENSVLNKERK